MAEGHGERYGREQAGETTRNAPVFVPLADIYETKDALHLLIELPGVAPSDLSVTLDKRVLTISARSRVQPPEGYSPTHREYRDGDYERTFSVSEAIDSERIEAELTDGLLRMRLPKAQPAPAKTINVKTGS